MFQLRERWYSMTYVDPEPLGVSEKAACRFPNAIDVIWLPTHLTWGITATMPGR